MARSSISAESPLGWLSTNGGSPETVIVFFGSGDGQFEGEFRGAAYIHMQAWRGLRRHSRRFGTGRIVSRREQFEGEAAKPSVVVE